MEFEFRCQTCDEIHKGMPSFGAVAPPSYYAVPEAERASRCELGGDDCVIDYELFLCVAVWKSRCAARINRWSGVSGSR
jgi:Uncharacterized protein conserved in bacteria (DUF2199)